MTTIGVPPTESTQLRLPLVDGGVVQTEDAPRSKLLLWLVPEKNPALWNAINSICFIWSFLLLWEILGVSNNVIEHLLSEQMYLVWNFGTTVLWCTETGSTVWYHGYSASKTSDRIQLGLAIYFLVDSIHLFYKWQNPELDVEEELFDVVIGTISFLGMLLYSTRALWEPLLPGRNHL